MVTETFYSLLKGKTTKLEVQLHRILSGLKLKKKTVCMRKQILQKKNTNVNDVTSMKLVRCRQTTASGLDPAPYI